MLDTVFAVVDERVHGFAFAQRLCTDGVNDDTALQGNSLNQLVVIAVEIGCFADCAGLVAVHKVPDLSLNEAPLLIVVHIIQKEHLSLDQLTAGFAPGIKD
ncbi:hypothetical protein D3C75_1073060 [compost metagenome]